MPSLESDDSAAWRECDGLISKLTGARIDTVVTMRGYLEALEEWRLELDAEIDSILDAYFVRLRQIEKSEGEGGPA